MGFMLCPFPSASLASEVPWRANEITFDGLGLIMITKLLYIVWLRLCSKKAQCRLSSGYCLLGLSCIGRVVCGSPRID